MAPLDLDKLRQVAQDWNLTVNSSQMPGVPVYKFYARDSKGSPSRTFKPLRMAWGVKEDKDDGWGIGILPMVEILGAIAAEKFPTRNVVIMSVDLDVSRWRCHVVVMFPCIASHLPFPFTSYFYFHHPPSP